MIVAQNLSKSFGSTRALFNVSLTVESAERTMLVGESGCGKSTLLRCLVGLISPDSGSIVADEIPVLPKNNADWRRKIGYVIQEGGLFPHLSIRKNLSIQSDYFGIESSKSEQRISELLDLVHLSADVLDRFPAQLSGGQRQRISLMRALMIDPPYIFLDEPLGALDPIIRFNLQKELLEIFTRLGKTVVMVTHDIQEALMLGTHISVMKNGEIIENATPENLVQNPSNAYVKQLLEAARL